jgi:hypothetical protein
MRKIFAHLSSVLNYSGYNPVLPLLLEDWRFALEPKSHGALPTRSKLRSMTNFATP